MSIARRNPLFARLLAALATSQFGDWLYNLALLAYVQERTHSAGWVGVTTAARIAPLVLGAPLGGLIADRFDRRALMIGSDVMRAAVMGALVLVALSGLPVVLVPLLAGTATLSGVAYSPTVAALTPRLVEPELLPAANAARGSIAPACVAAGPALGALLLLVGPPAFVFAINAATFVLSALIVGSIPAGGAFARPERTAECAPAGVPGEAPAPTELTAAGALRSIAADLRAGASALRATPEGIRMVSADSAASFVYGAQTVLLLLVATRLGLGADGYGYLLGAQGAGGIAGATLAGRLGERGGRRLTLAIALASIALPLPVLAFTTSLAVAILVSVIAGAGALLVEVAADIRLQQKLEPSRIGCAYGLMLTASVGAMMLGGLLAPLLVALAGTSGALCLVAAAVLMLALKIAQAGPSSLSSPSRWALPAASTRVRASSLARIRVTCTVTVFWLMNRLAAISRLVAPPAISLSTSSSRAVSPIRSAAEAAADSTSPLG
jgi:MFS family permease